MVEGNIKPSKEFTEKRRKIVSDLMFKRGIGSQAEIIRILKKEFNIVASRETVSRDKKSLGDLRFDDEMRSFDNFLLAKMKRNYIAQELLAEAAHDAGDIRIEADVRKKLSSMSKEFHEVNHKVFEADKRSSPRLKEQATAFSFGSVDVVKPVSKTEDEVEDK